MPRLSFFWFFISEIRLSFFLVWLLNFFLVQTFLFFVVYFLDFPFLLVVYFLPRLFDFFSCPEFPFFLVICFLEFLLFVVAYFLPRLSDFLTQTFMFTRKLMSDRHPFFVVFS